MPPQRQMFLAQRRRQLRSEDFISLCAFSCARRYTKQQTTRELGGFVFLFVCERQDLSAKESGSGVFVVVVVSGVEKRILRILTCTRCNKFSRFPFLLTLDMRQNLHVLASGNPGCLKSYAIGSVSAGVLLHPQRK